MNIFYFFSSKILGKYKSKINKNIEIVENKGRKIIYVLGAEQTGGTITGMWKKALENLPISKDRRLNILLLGLGGGDVVRIIKKLYPVTKITVIEIDEQMIQVAEEFFDITGSKEIKIINKDAQFFIKNNKQKFDLIVIDLFIGFHNPEKFRKSEFLLNIKKSLSKNGIAVYNSHFNANNPSDYENFLKRCQAVFTDCKTLISYRFSRILFLSGH